MKGDSLAMAAVSAPPSAVAADVTSNISDCPQCGSLCVGAFVLPCGHLTCRKCLRDHYGAQLTCLTCRRQLHLPRSAAEDFSLVVHKLVGVDPVVQQLVSQRLWGEGQGQRRCQVCDDLEAQFLCQDCKERYCGGCAKLHGKQGMSKDHALQTLVVTGSASRSHRNRTESSGSGDSADSAVGSGSAQEHLRLPERTPDDQADGSSETGAKRWTLWVLQVVGWLQEAAVDQRRGLDALGDLLALVQDTHLRAQAREQLLLTYIRQLPLLKAVKLDDANTFHVNSAEQDDSVVTNVDSLQQRLRHIVHERQTIPASDVTALTNQLKGLANQYQCSRDNGLGNSMSILKKSKTVTFDNSEHVEPAHSTLSLPPASVTTSLTASASSSECTETSSRSLVAWDGEEGRVMLTVNSSHNSAPFDNSHSRSLFSSIRASHRASHSHSKPPAADPMTAQPRRAFALHLECQGEESAPGITSIVCTKDGRRLVMADVNNLRVKAVDIKHRDKPPAYLDLQHKPYGLAVLGDGLLALTTLDPVIYLLKVGSSSGRVKLVSALRTAATYRGVAGYGEGPNLLVSCSKVDGGSGGGNDGEGSARVDVINRQGQLLRTLADSRSLPGLSKPRYLCSAGLHLWVSDYDSCAVYKLDVTSGQVVETLSHGEMRWQYQVAVDATRHLYVASAVGNCVLVRSPQGQWRKLVEASRHSEQGYDRPWGICLTSTGRLVVAWTRDGTRVIAYDL